MEEERLIRENEDFIRSCAWKYMNETQMSPSSFDDVYQEAALAYLNLYRRIESGALPPGSERYARAVIRYALLKKFVDRHGMGVRFSNVRGHRAPRVNYRPENPAYVDDDADFASVYIRDWISSLPDEDREIVTSKISTGKPPETWRKSNTAYRYRIHRIRRSFDDYFLAR